MRQDTNGGSRPIPDPTILTAQLVVDKIAGLREIIETRLDASDKAITLLQERNDKIPMMVEDRVDHLQELHNEKFKSIDIQFVERDTRTAQIAAQNKLAIDAALQAQKEAVGEQNKSNTTAIAKSEAATTKQLDTTAELIQVNAKSFDDKIADIKDRIGTIEKQFLNRSASAELATTVKTTAMEGQAKGASDTLAFIFSIIAIAGTIVGIFIALTRS